MLKQKELNKLKKMNKRKRMKLMIILKMKMDNNTFSLARLILKKGVIKENKDYKIAIDFYNVFASKF